MVLPVVLRQHHDLAIWELECEYVSVIAKQNLWVESCGIFK